MRGKARVVVLVISHLLAIAVGAAGVYLWSGVYAQRVLREGNAMLTQVALMSRYSLFLDTQRTNAGLAEYREALKVYLAAVEEAARYPSPFFGEKVLAFDTTLTLERLSRIEREIGHPTEADAYLQSAVAACGRTGWKDCSPEHITRTSKRLEEAGSGSPAADRTMAK